MSTERLYYTDSYLTEFDATVERVEQHDGRLVAILNRSAFYPTSGGQPFDTGILDDSRVIEVLDSEDGTISHFLQRPLSAGASVHGVVDWSRRFDHMQQHSGQHLLSAAFDRLFAVRTVSFHLGDDSCTIDLSRDVSPAELTAAETDANRVVWENRTVNVTFMDAANAASIGLRKESTRGGTLRIVEIADYDRSACGGTHVGRTGAVGVIAIQSSERFKGGTRVSFVCGGRALKTFGMLRDVVGEGIRRLSVLPAELPSAIDRIQTESRDLRKALKTAQERLATYEAAELAARAAPCGPAGLVAEIVDGDGAILKALATAITARDGYLVVLVSASSAPLMVIARSKEILIDVRNLFRQLIERLGGKGGGSSELVQGGGFSGSAETVLEAARQLARTGLTSEIR